jgi:hypothetical protein
VIGETTIPLAVRLRFGRAAVQVVADQIGADILHIKGDAVDPSLRPHRFGTDVDILVRPRHVRLLDEAVRGQGWQLYSSFEYGSPFGHAQTYLHDSWGHLDLHRSFPGIRLDPDEAFDVLARDGSTLDVAGVTCAVPGVSAQAALLLLNAARAGGHRDHDVAALWDAASPEQQGRIRALVGELRADVAFAAAIGGLEHHRHAPDYRLWKVISEGGSRSEEWWARVRAAPTLGSALRVIARAPRVNVERLAHDLGREPTRREVLLASLKRPATALSDAWRRSRGDAS